MKIPYLVMMLVSLGAIEARSSDLPLSALYYTPFRSRLDKPVTMANVQTNSQFRFNLTGTNETSGLLKLLRHGDSSDQFNKDAVRLLLVEDGGRRMFVDDRGNVFDGNAKSRLKAKDFELLKSMVCDVIDAKCECVVYFMPFETETYDAITPANIRERADYILDLADRKTISTLADTLSHGTRSNDFDNKKVRLLVTLNHGSERVLVDAGGRVSTAHARFVLGTQGFDSLRQLIANLINANRPRSAE
jgi:hypothetical protein